MKLRKWDSSESQALIARPRLQQNSTSSVSFLGIPLGLRCMAKFRFRTSQLWSVSASGSQSLARFLVLIQNLKRAMVANAISSTCKLRYLCWCNIFRVGLQAAPPAQAPGSYTDTSSQSLSSSSQFLALIITIICWGVIRCWAPGCAFRLYSLSLVHAVRKVVLTLPRRNRPGPKPCYRLVDPPACSAVTVETKVFFCCANPRKNVDTKRLLYRFGRKPGSDCWVFTQSKRIRQREEKGGERGQTRGEIR